MKSTFYLKAPSHDESMPPSYYNRSNNNNCNNNNNNNRSNSLNEPFNLISRSRSYTNMNEDMISNHNQDEFVNITSSSSSSSSTTAANNTNGGLSKIKSNLKRFFSKDKSKNHDNDQQQSHHKSKLNKASSPSNSSLNSIKNDNNNSNSNAHEPRSLGKAKGAHVFHNLTFHQSQSLHDTLNNHDQNFKTSDIINSIIIGSSKSSPHVQKTINSKIPDNFHNDEETLKDFNRKLEMLSLKDRIDLQKKCYDLLNQQIETKKVEVVSLKADLEELRSILVKKHEQIRSQAEIEQIKNEIRILTNEQAELINKISLNSNWNCKKCNFSNTNESVKCSSCKTERNQNEVLICNYCGTKNALINEQCQRCNSYLADTSGKNQIDDNNNYLPPSGNRRDRTASSNSSCSNSMTKHPSTNSLPSPVIDNITLAQRNPFASGTNNNVTKTPPLPPGRKISNNSPAASYSPTSPPINQPPVNYNYINNNASNAISNNNNNSKSNGTGSLAQSNSRMTLNLVPQSTTSINSNNQLRSPLISPRSRSPTPFTQLNLGPFDSSSCVQQKNKKLFNKS